EQQHATTQRDALVQQLEPLRLQFERLLAMRQQEHPVEYRGGECVDVFQHLPWPGRSAEHPLQVLRRCQPFGPAPQVEIAGDRIQAKPRQPTPAMQRDRADQPDRETAATFRPALPMFLLAHAAPSTMPRASTVPSRSILNPIRDASASAWLNCSCADSSGSSGATNFASITRLS